MVRDSLPTRALTNRPDLDHLKRQAKQLLNGFRAGAPDAVAEVTAHYRDADPATFALHTAQLVIARAYGFESWPKLRAFVDGATTRRVIEAVRARDLPQVRALLQSRPELSSSGLHAAVTERAPEIVRALMQHGANARAGIYPHRDATSPLIIATEREYDEIVSIIREEERNRQQRKGGVAAAADDLFHAIRSGTDAHALALLNSDPALIRTRHAVFDVTPLMVAAQMLNVALVASLLDRGADPNERGLVHPFDDLEQRPSRDTGQTSLDVAAYRVGLWGEGADAVPRFREVATLLLHRGAELTARGAVALGDAPWLRTRHAEGTLANRIDEGGGLLRIAVSHNRPEILHLLLQFGFDPDERTRFRDVAVDDVALTWGMPLWHCAADGRHEMAERLLSHGADPNAAVYASGTPMSEAFGREDWRMIALLERHGGIVEPWVAAQYRQSDRVRESMAAVPDKGTFAETLIGPAACGGSPETLRLVLAHIEWGRDDPRWFGVLEQPLRMWHHSGRHWARPDWDRAAYQTCFRMILERCNPDIRGRDDGVNPFGLTILHSVAGSRDHVTADDRLAFATMLLDAGARLDVRDHVLNSTPLGWASRWGRVELVRLYLARGADPVEADAEPWATPIAWAEKKGHQPIIDLLRECVR